MAQKTGIKIGPSVLTAIRKSYEETWGFRWPFDRQYLAELVIEAKSSLGMAANDKTRAKDVRREALVLMRETHHFPDHAAPFGNGRPARDSA